MVGKMVDKVVEMMAAERDASLVHYLVEKMGDWKAVCSDRWLVDGSVSQMDGKMAEPTEDMKAEMMVVL